MLLHNSAGHVIEHLVDSTCPDPHPRFMIQETRMGGNQVDVPLGPWLSRTRQHTESDLELLLRRLFMTLAVGYPDAS